MTTLPTIAWEDLPTDSSELPETGEILVRSGGVVARAQIALLPTPTPPTPPAEPKISVYDVTGVAAPAPGSIAGDSYDYTVELGNISRIAVARVVGFHGAAPHPAKTTPITTIAQADYASATGSVTIPAGTSLDAGDTYTLRLQVYETGQALTDEPVAYADYHITAEAPSGGLDQAQVDARVRALVDALYLSGDTDPYPIARIPSGIARDAEVTAAVQGLQSAAQVRESINIALDPYRTAEQIAALISGASHLRARGAWEATSSYRIYDVVWHKLATYLALTTVAGSSAAATEPGAGTAWRTSWWRIGYSSQAPPAANHPRIQQYDVTGDAAPVAGDIGGDSYGYTVALAETGSVGAARIVGFRGTAPHPAKGDLTSLATIAAADYASASGSVSIPSGVSLSAGATYTLRLEVYETGQAVATDQPYAYHDYRITAVAAPLPSIAAWTVAGHQSPTAGDIGGAEYSYTLRVTHAAQVASARVLQFFAATQIRATQAVVIPSSGSATGTVTIRAGTRLAAGQSYTLRAEIYAAGLDPATDPPTSHADYVITAVAPPVHPSIGNFAVRGEASPAPGSIAGDSYSYSYSISQSAHASSVRIVAGKRPTSGYPLAGQQTIRQIAQDDLPGGTGTLRIPSGVTLADEETYIIRLEVYESGQTVGTSTPVAYHDYHITAHAAALRVHFGWVSATQGVADIDPDNTDHADTRSTVVGNWTVTGLPSDSNSRLYFLVPTTGTQPGGYTVDGRVQDVLFADEGEHVVDGDRYHVYLVPDFYAVSRGAYEGEVITVRAPSSVRRRRGLIDGVVAGI